MYSRKVGCETFFDRRESNGSSKSLLGSDNGSSKDGSPSSTDHYNPTLRLLQIPRSSNGSMGFQMERSKWDPYPWISAVDTNTAAKFHGLKTGECILEVNGEDVLGMRISEIANLINSETKTIDNVALLLWSPGSDIKCNPTNLCCGPMPLNLERLTAYTQTILAIIECPVCLETIAPPALQCQNGHILCVKCRILSHSCPVCRQHFYPGRSLVAEQIYNSIMDTFNLRNSDKLQGSEGQQLFGAKHKRPSYTSLVSSLPMDERRRREKQQHHGICLKPPPLEVNKFGSQPPSTNKFLTKLRSRSYSMDNLNSPDRRRHRQSVSLLSVTRITIEDDDIGVGVGVGGPGHIDNNDDDGNGNSKTNRTSDNSNEQLEFGKLFEPAFGPRPTTATISKHFSLSANDLSKKDNDGKKATQHECLSKNRLRYLWLERNSAQMALLPIIPPSPPTSPALSQRKITSIGGVKHLKDGTVQIYCCTADPPVYFCPLSCGKQFSGQTLQQHIKVDHCAPILCFNSSSAELALPLRAPLDKAAVLLMCDGKDFWIKLRTHGEGSITALALFQGPEDESSDFMMETRLRNQISKDQDDNDDDDDNDCVKIVVNNDDGILEQELITRSIVRSMIVTTWEDEETSYVTPGDSGGGSKKDEKSRGFLYNQENIRMTFGEEIDYQNLLLKIIIKRR